MGEWLISALEDQKHLHPVEIISYIAWTWHGIFRFVYAIKVETFLNTWLLGVKLIRNVWEETSSFNAKTNKQKNNKRNRLLLMTLKKNPKCSMLKNTSCKINCYIGHCFLMFGCKNLWSSPFLTTPLLTTNWIELKSNLWCGDW